MENPFRISEKQVKRLWAKYFEARITQDQLKQILEKHGFKDPKEIEWMKYDTVINEILALKTDKTMDEALKTLEANALPTEPQK